MLPLLLGFYAVWVQRPRWRAGLPAAFTSSATGAAIWGLVFVLSAGVLGYVPVHDARVARRAEAVQRDAAAAGEAEASASRQANLDRYQRLTDASPLWEWQEFIGKGNALEAQAVARVRVLPQRQADAEAMLRDDKDFPLLHIRQLDLHATAAFCASASAFLTSNATAHRAGKTDKAYYLTAEQFDPYLPAMQILVAQHCDLGPAIAAIEAAVRTYPPAAQRDDFLRSLAHLHPDWRACAGADGATLTQRIAGCTAVIDAGSAGGDDLAVAWFNRGAAHLAQDQGAQAIQDYTAAIRSKPAYAEAFNGRGNAYDDTGAHEQALRDYDEALRINPAFAVAFSNRGLVHDARGDHDLRSGISTRHCASTRSIMVH